MKNQKKKNWKPKCKHQYEMKSTFGMIKGELQVVAKAVCKLCGFTVHNERPRRPKKYLTKISKPCYNKNKDTKRETNEKAQEAKKHTF